MKKSPAQRRSSSPPHFHQVTETQKKARCLNRNVALAVWTALRRNVLSLCWWQIGHISPDPSAKLSGQARQHECYLQCCLNWDTELFGVERTLKYHLVPPPLAPPCTGMPPTRSGCSGPHPIWSWTLLGMGHPHYLDLSGQPFPVPHYPLSREFLPYNI